MRFVNDRERVAPMRCPNTGHSVHFHFTRQPFRVPLGSLSCPACGRDHADEAKRLAEANGLSGWRVQVRLGDGPPGHEFASAYGLPTTTALRQERIS